VFDRLFNAEPKLQRNESMLGHACGTPHERTHARERSQREKQKHMQTNMRSSVLDRRVHAEKPYPTVPVPLFID
jgi:hypothetical protein